MEVLLTTWPVLYSFDVVGRAQEARRAGGAVGAMAMEVSACGLPDYRTAQEPSRYGL